MGQQLHKLFPFANGPGDHLTFLQQGNVIVGLVDNIEVLLKMCDGKQAAVFSKSTGYLKGFANVVPLTQQWVSFRQQWIREADLTALEFASITLEHNFPEPVVTGAELDRLKTELSDLHESVMSTNFDQSLKALVLESLEEIGRAFAEYELRGAKGLDSALGSAIGRALLHSGFSDNGSKRDEQPDPEAKESTTEIRPWQDLFWILMTHIGTSIDPAGSPKHIERLVGLVQRKLPAQSKAT